jgi:hypothetical protein
MARFSYSDVNQYMHKLLNVIADHYEKNILPKLQELRKSKAEKGAPMEGSPEEEASESPQEEAMEDKQMADKKKPAKKQPPMPKAKKGKQ